MHLSIYVHDFHPQIGHSRAMQELINGLTADQKSSVSSIEIVAFTCSDLNTLFPDYNCPKYFTQIPFPTLKPFLLKMFIYHLISFSHSVTKGFNRKKIGIGISCINVDIVNVQFIHEQWKKYFFQNKKFSLASKLYKQLLFLYFSICEKYIYAHDRKTKYVVIANFLKTFLQQHFNTNLSNVTLIPSGVNTSEFEIQNIEKSALIQKIASSHPQISEIDASLPIALFVGAFERKGLDRVLETLNKVPNAQLIVVGKSEQSNFEMPNLSFKIIHIPFTKEVNLFYQLSDIFIFPTRYEPFGLVIVEAYVMGLDLVLPIENVGASEIIPKSEGINYFHQDEEIVIHELKILSFNEKSTRRSERLKNIEQYSWKSSGNKLYSILSES